VSPTNVPPRCVGNCDGSGDVTVTDLIKMVNIALETLPVSDCPVGDANGDGSISIDEILKAVNNALNGCPVASAMAAGSGR
jgi:hypothetical protein